MKNLVALAVHRDGGLDGGAAENFVQGLVSQAHPQDGDMAIEMGDDHFADARLIRGLGARRDAEPVGRKRRDAGQIDLVVAEDQDLQVELVKELHQVIGKGVVVVDHHQAHRPPLPVGADLAASEAHIGAPQKIKIKKAAQLSLGGSRLT